MNREINMFAGVFDWATKIKTMTDRTQQQRGFLFGLDHLKKIGVFVIVSMISSGADRWFSMLLSNRPTR